MNLFRCASIFCTDQSSKLTYQDWRSRISDGPKLEILKPCFTSISEWYAWSKLCKAQNYAKQKDHAMCIIIQMVQIMQSAKLCKIERSCNVHNYSKYAMCRIVQSSKLCKVQNYAMCKILKRACKVQKYAMLNYAKCNIFNNAKLCSKQNY